TQYAEAPLLNSQQLVLSFVHPVRSATRWDRQNVQVGVQEKGVYLVEAVRKELRAYTILIVSDVVMITKTGNGRILNWVVDRATREPVANVPVTALVRDGDAGRAVTDVDGVAELKTAPAQGKDVRLVARNGGDYAVNLIPNGASGANGEQWNGYIYTDRPVY